jgi:hypothetical protein
MISRERNTPRALALLCSSRARWLPRQRVCAGGVGAG